MKSVLIGMSGGVDSSVSAAILKEQGYRVIGATMILNDNYAGADDAKKVCDKIGIEFRTIDFSDKFKEYVINYFIDEYTHGKTPNPCLMCNKYLKFGAMFEYAKQNDIDYIATGHYAKVELDETTGKYILRTADVMKKDQSYVLYSLTQEQLSRTLMPLATYNKERVRQIAEEIGLDIANKPDSQEICFVEDDNYARYICENSNYKPKEGDILDINGNVIGRHKGIIYYTIGQRKGIGAYGRPMFVMKINPKENTIILGEKGMEFSQSLTAHSVNFMSGELPKEPIRVEARIRYQARPAAATVTVLDNDRIKVDFDEPQRAITPGQAVVLYNGDIVVGGGIVE